MVIGQGQEVEPDRPFQFGFSRALLWQYNKNDAQAAVKVWAEALVNEGAFQADPTIRVFDNAETMCSALQSKKIDGLVFAMDDFITIKDKVKFDRFIFNVTAGSIWDQYVLLVHRDSGLTKLEELQGRTLTVLRHAKMCLAVPWLDTLLLEKGLKTTSGYCGRITHEIKLAKTVLPVFFKQTDACLVTRKGFKMMGELNPQVTRHLRELTSSPKMVVSGFFIRSGYPKALQDRIVHESTRVQTTASGQQILTVFQCERLEEHPASVLDSAIALMETHRRLLAGSRNPKTVAANLAPQAPQGAFK